jgi:hypothetical protein
MSRFGSVSAERLAQLGVGHRLDVVTKVAQLDAVRFNQFCDGIVVIGITPAAQRVFPVSLQLHFGLTPRRLTPAASNIIEPNGRS